MTAGYRPADRVGVIDDGDAVYVAPLPRGPIVVLDGTAALVWRAACDGPADTIAARVADRVDEAAEGIEGAVDAFVADLLDRGLLARA